MQPLRTRLCVSLNSKGLSNLRSSPADETLDWLRSADTSSKRILLPFSLISFGQSPSSRLALLRLKPSTHFFALVFLGDGNLRGVAPLFLGVHLPGVPTLRGVCLPDECPLRGVRLLGVPHFLGVCLLGVVRLCNFRRIHRDLRISIDLRRLGDCLTRSDFVILHSSGLAKRARLVCLLSFLLGCLQANRWKASDFNKK